MKGTKFKMCLSNKKFSVCNAIEHLMVDCQVCVQPFPRCLKKNRLLLISSNKNGLERTSFRRSECNMELDCKVFVALAALLPQADKATRFKISLCIVTIMTQEDCAEKESLLIC